LEKNNCETQDSNLLIFVIIISPQYNLIPVHTIKI